jgi:plastocyanin
MNNKIHIIILVALLLISVFIILIRSSLKTNLISNSKTAAQTLPPATIPPITDAKAEHEIAIFANKLSPSTYTLDGDNFVTFDTKDTKPHTIKLIAYPENTNLAQYQAFTLGPNQEKGILLPISGTYTFQDEQVPQAKVTITVK